MSNVETRQIGRDSLFLLAQLRVDGKDDQHRVKVRNLSAGGMMAEGAIEVSRGQRVDVELRNIGWVQGSVAWKQEDRFGIAFVDEIEPLVARAPMDAQTSTEDFEAARCYRPAVDAVTKERLRKI